MRATTSWFRNFQQGQYHLNKIKGFTVMDDFDEQSKLVVTTFRETKGDLDNFFLKDNEFWQIWLKNSNPILKDDRREGITKYQILTSDCLVNLKKAFACVKYRSSHRKSSRLNLKKGDLVYLILSNLRDIYTTLVKQYYVK